MRKVFVVLLILSCLVFYSIFRVFEALKIETGLFASSAGKTILANHLHSVVQNKIYQCNEKFVDVFRDVDNRITSIHVQTNRIDRFVSEVTEDLLNAILSFDCSEYGIPLGNLFGLIIFSGKGPLIRVKPVLLGSIANEVKSEFFDAGINQTLHRITLNYAVTIQYLSPIHSVSNTISISISLAETVIVGEVPIYRD